MYTDKSRTVLNPQLLDSLLALSDRDALVQAVRRLPAPVSLADLRPLAAHAAVLQPALQPLRVAFVHTYTSELLQPWLEIAAALYGLVPEVYHAPFGVVEGEANADSGLVQHRPELTVLMFQRHDVHPSLAHPVARLSVPDADVVRQQGLERIKSIVRAFRAQPVGQLVLSLLPAMAGPALGYHDVQAERSEVRFWRRFQDDICLWLREEFPSVMWLDLDELINEIGRRRALEPRHWLTSRYPFSSEGSLEVAFRLATIGRLLKTPKAKVLVLDADNTLWGGVIGEDGIDGIALGPDYPGNAYVAFQMRLLEIQQRGFILAMCSKNNAADLDEVLAHHPHQVLKARHFVARRVNWEPKPANLQSLAEELNLGLDSFVFVDDSDHECAAVRAQCPQVEVIQVPKRAHEVPYCLDRVARLEVLSLTAEDRAKTEMYQAEQQRREILSLVQAEGGEAGHLRRLGMRMLISVDEPRHASRLAQLTQKTNQFNLSTRRYDERQISQFIESPDWMVLDFSLTDVYGDSGIVGLALVRFTGPGEAELDSFLMSCRVIGRCAEDAFMFGMLHRVQQRGVGVLRACFRPTAKNALVQGLLPRLQFMPLAQNAEQDFVRDLGTLPPGLPAEFPIHIAWAADAPSVMNAHATL